MVRNFDTLQRDRLTEIGTLPKNCHITGAYPIKTKYRERKKKKEPKVHLKDQKRSISVHRVRKKSKYRSPGSKSIHQHERGRPGGRRQLLTTTYHEVNLQWEYELQPETDQQLKTVLEHLCSLGGDLLLHNRSMKKQKCGEKGKTAPATFATVMAMTNIVGKT
jgi:hypothetical protein